MDSQEFIGLVTVTYNSAKVLPGFLRSIEIQSHANFILYVVDNASTDETLAMLRNWPDKRLRLLSNNQNFGIAAGNNQGIRQALEDGCDSVLLINNDTEFNPDLISTLARELRAQNVDIVCPKIMYFDEPTRIWAAGGRFDKRLGYRPVHLAGEEIDHGQCDQPRLIDYTPTCCVLIRRSVFEAVGLMDERYFVYFDDVDFMYRAVQEGMKILYSPATTLLHKVGRLTGGGESLFSVRYCTRNRVYFLRRHLGPFRSLWTLLLYELHYLRGLLSGGLSPKVFYLKHKATWEGLFM